MNVRTRALATLLFAVDIQRGAVRADSPSYAVVVRAGDNLDRDVVSLRQPLRLHDRA